MGDVFPWVLLALLFIVVNALISIGRSGGFNGISINQTPRLFWVTIAIVFVAILGCVYVAAWSFSVTK